MRLSKVIILLSMVFIGSCVDPFIPATTSYDNILYIECLLSNDNSSVQKVRISHSTPIISSTGINSIVQRANVSGAMVRVFELDSESSIFSETLPGIYEADSSFRPEIGKTYKLEVLFEGNTFESDEVTMMAGTSIDSISFKHTKEKVSESSPVYDGYHFYVSTHDDSDGPSYFRWASEATYFFRSFYDATHIYINRTQVPANNNDVKFCWTSNTMKGIYVTNTEGLTENKVLESPLHFQSQYGDALSIRYSLNVKQYKISRDVWQFWNQMARQVNQNGGMYDTQPFRIEGNIRCTSDPTVMVTGIFEVAGYSEKRIYVDRPLEFDILPVFCPRDEIGTRDLPWYRIPSGSYIIYDYDVGAYMYSSPQCFDCTLKNGTLEKPDFWDDGN